MYSIRTVSDTIVAAAAVVLGKFFRLVKRISLVYSCH